MPTGMVPLGTVLWGTKMTPGKTVPQGITYSLSRSFCQRVQTASLGMRRSPRSIQRERGHRKSPPQDNLERRPIISRGGALRDTRGALDARKLARHNTTQVFYLG